MTPMRPPAAEGRYYRRSRKTLRSSESSQRPHLRRRSSSRRTGSLGRTRSDDAMVARLGRRRLLPAYDEPLLEFEHQSRDFRGNPASASRLALRLRRGTPSKKNSLRGSGKSAPSASIAGLCAPRSRRNPTWPAMRMRSGKQCFNYNVRCTRTTVVSSGTACTVNLSFRANVSIGTLSAITEPSIVL